MCPVLAMFSDQFCQTETPYRVFGRNSCLRIPAHGLPILSGQAGDVYRDARKGTLILWRKTYQPGRKFDLGRHNAFPDVKQLSEGLNPCPCLEGFRDFHVPPGHRVQEVHQTEVAEKEDGHETDSCAASQMIIGRYLGACGTFALILIPFEISELQLRIRSNRHCSDIDS